jgi:hypothetical protein
LPQSNPKASGVGAPDAGGKLKIKNHRHFNFPNSKGDFEFHFRIGLDFPSLFSAVRICQAIYLSDCSAKIQIYFDFGKS